MTKIRDNLYVGDADWAKPDRIGELHSRGITAILNVAAEINDLAGRDFGITICKAGIAEQATGDIPNITAAVAFLDWLLTAGHTVYIHCAGGANRSPYISALCLAKRENKTFDEVLSGIIAV